MSVFISHILEKGTGLRSENKIKNNVIALLYRICSFFVYGDSENKGCTGSIRDTWVEFEGPLTTTTVKLMR